MQIQKVSNQPSFQGKLSVITFMDMGKDVIVSTIKTSEYQDRRLRMVGDQIVKRVKLDSPDNLDIPECPKAVKLEKDRAGRFADIIEWVTGWPLEMNPNKAKLMLNEDDRILFADRFAEKGGVLVKIDLQG